MAGGYWWYRYRQPDLCMLTLGVCSLLAVGTAAILTSAGWGWYRNVGSLFLIGILIALLLGAGANCYSTGAERCIQIKPWSYPDQPTTNC